MSRKQENERTLSGTALCYQAFLSQQAHVVIIYGNLSSKCKDSWFVLS